MSANPWTDCFGESVEEVLAAHWAGTLDRSHLEEELLFLAEQFGAYLLLRQDREGNLGWGFFRESSVARVDFQSEEGIRHIRPSTVSNAG